MTIKGIARSCLGDVFDSHEELDKLTESYHKCWLEMEVTGTFKLLFIPYGQKYWWELNLTVEPKIAIARIFLADLNLAVRYWIAIRIYASRKFLRILIWRL